LGSLLLLTTRLLESGSTRPDPDEGALDPEGSEPLDEPPDDEPPGKPEDPPDEPGFLTITEFGP